MPPRLIAEELARPFLVGNLPGDVSWLELLQEDGIDAKPANWEYVGLVERGVTILEGNNLSHFVTKVDNHAIVLQLREKHG